jgi:hypothetical protein
MATASARAPATARRLVDGQVLGVVTATSANIGRIGQLGGSG